jgi:NAD(P)-dependent dehydrogenase (short-subunit alcohol dehydrogenase family)
MTRYNLEGRVVAITGSTGGLGAALSTALRARGAKLALLDLDGGAVAAQAEKLGGPSVARGWQVDVRSLESLEQALQAAAKHFGGVDVVIANAGIGEIGPMEFMDPALFERVIDINLTGVWRTFRAGLPHVRPRQGSLVAIASMASFVHSPLQAHYTASKAGVWALCDSIRLELRHQGVQVCSVHPTFFPTPLMDSALTHSAGAKLWGGNKGGMWKMVSLNDVVSAIVSGIEARRDMVVIPRQNTPVARAPGIFRRIIETLGFRDNDIADAIRLSAPDRADT